MKKLERIILLDWLPSPLVKTLGFIVFFIGLGGFLIYWSRDSLSLWLTRDNILLALFNGLALLIPIIILAFFLESELSKRKKEKKVVSK